MYKRKSDALQDSSTPWHRPQASFAKGNLPDEDNGVSGQDEQEFKELKHRHWWSRFVFSPRPRTRPQAPSGGLLTGSRPSRTPLARNQSPCHLGVKWHHPASFSGALSFQACPQGLQAYVVSTAAGCPAWAAIFFLPRKTYSRLPHSGQQRAGLTSWPYGLSLILAHFRCEIGSVIRAPTGPDLVKDTRASFIAAVGEQGSGRP